MALKQFKCVCTHNTLIDFELINGEIEKKVGKNQVLQIASRMSYAILY